jgi:hypothetical protein
MPFEKVYTEYSEAVKAEKSKGYFSISTDSESGSSSNENAYGIPKIPEVPLNDYANPSNVNDIQRFPDRKLYLLVDTAEGWRFPCWMVKDEDFYRNSLISFIEDCRKSYFEGDAELYVTGNAPICHHVERFKDRVKPPFSSVHFFYKCQLIRGSLSVPKEYRWATSEEVKSVVPAGYWGAIKDVLSH